MAKWMKIKTSGEWLPFNEKAYLANPETFEKIEKNPLYLKQKATGRYFAFSPQMASRSDMDVLYEVPEELKTSTSQDKGKTDDDDTGGSDGSIPDDATLEAMEFTDLKKLLSGKYTGTPKKADLIALAKEIRDAQHNQ